MKTDFEQRTADFHAGLIRDDRVTCSENQIVNDVTNVFAN
jgi:hypothetical protein